ncbi:MAG: PAS domain S-box protein [Desulfovibrio aminophilus]|uniref:PAS domain S-box protein n=1 Tax=Desulfovibrio aminophilus TaxID=81425 RepID=UPI002A388977|nr:PAS domain S-box protein [Desulfovibrionaceae bacterium]
MQTSRTQPTAGTAPHRRTAVLGALAVCLGLFLMLFVLSRPYEAERLEEERREVRDSILAPARFVSDTVAVRVGMLFVLESFVRHDAATPERLAERFRDIAEALPYGFKDVRVLALAPGGVVGMVSPLKGNEAALGHDLLRDPGTSEDAQRTLLTREVTLGGPYELRQGGLGLVLRKAVFLDDGTFWGFAAAALDVDALVRSTPLPAREDLVFALARDGNIFHGLKEIRAMAPLSVNVPLPEGSWELLAAPALGWEGRIAGTLTLFRWTGAAFVLLLTVLTYLLLRRHDLLRRAKTLAEDQVRAGENRYRRIFNSTLDGLVLFDASGLVLDANPAACAMHGSSPGGLNGLTARDLVHPAFLRQFQEFARTVAVGGEFRVEARALRRDGSSFPVEVGGASFDSNGGTRFLAMVRDLSERDRLRSEQERFFSLTLDLVGVTNLADGRFRQINASWTRVLGYAPEEILGRDWRGFVHPDDLEDTVAAHGGAVGGVAVQSFVNRWRAKDGQWRWLSWNALPDPERGVAYAVARDVTGEREAALRMREANEELSALNEELLAINEELRAEVELRGRAEREVGAVRRRLENILENMASGVTVFRAVDDGRDFVITGFNRAAERMEHIDRAQVLGRRLSEVFPGAADFGLTDMLRRVLASGEPERLPLALYRDERIQGWRENYVYPLPGGEVVALYEDRDEQVAAREALRASEERFGLAVAGSSDGIWDWPDMSRDDLWWSPRLYELLGYAPDELPASMETFNLLLHPGDRERVQEALRRHLERRDPYSVEYRTACKGGEYRWFLARGQALFDSSGKPRRMAGSLQDINERRLAAEQLAAANQQMAAANEELAALNEEMAATNDRLMSEAALRREVEEHLRASLREKEVLLKEIHHRVKNNLQVVSSLLGLQAGAVTDPEVLALFEEGKNRIASMALVHEELYRSSDLARVDLGAYLEKLVHRLVAGLSGNRRVNLVLEVESIRLNVDAAIPCGLMVNELVTNALKHGLRERSEGRLLVQCRAAEGQVLLRVADDGPGFPPGLDFRNTETLGMQLVTHLAEQLQGRVDLEPGPGCSFRVLFPEKKP